MDEYRKMLDDLMRSESDVIISNGSADHATPLIAKLFEKANQKVKILTGCLLPSIYAKDEVVNAAGSFLLQDGTTLSIIVENQEAINNMDILLNDETGFIGSLRSKFGQDILKRIKLFAGTPEIRELPFHFMLVDDNAFRFEPDKNKFVALASFNNKAAAANLEAAMTKWLSSGITPIPIN